MAAHVCYWWERRVASIWTGVTWSPTSSMRIPCTATLARRPFPRKSPRVLQEKGRREETLSVAVERGADNRFETDLALKDYTSSTNINVPLIFDLQNSVRRTDWSFGPGSIIAGYENRYEVSYDRDPKTRGSYSMLLGLFKQSWSPNGNRTRLLWFISFGG